MASQRLAAIVLGDLMLDVVLAPTRPLASGTDVPGRVSLVQGGSAANTACWLARLGVRTTLVTAVGRDAVGRSLIASVRDRGVSVKAYRPAGIATGRIGVFLSPDGERSFVADRGAADALGPEQLQRDWFPGVDVLHLPAYSLLGAPLGRAGAAAASIAHGAGVSVTLDLASSGPLLAGGRRAARDLIESALPDLIFATASEASALLGSQRDETLLELAPVAVIKRGGEGATVLARGTGSADATGVLRFEVATRSLPVADSTGAGDAFDAGFLVGWLTARAAGGSPVIALNRGAVAGHRAAARQLTSPRPEMVLG